MLKMSRSKRYYCCLLGIILIAILVYWYIIHLYIFGTNSPPDYVIKNFNKAIESQSKPKTIMYWNNFFGEKHFGYGIGQSPFETANCKTKNCVIWDKADGSPSIPVEQFDAIIFHTLNIPSKPSKRSSHQRYIFFLRESPSTETRDYTSFNNFFNWTITYRRDSDVYLPYGFILNKSRTSSEFFPDRSPKWIEPVYDNIAVEREMNLKSRTKLVAWFVSHCSTESDRGAYVRDLSKYISVDIYGSCGTLTCRRSESHKCNRMVEDNYKYYLAFENSLCEDYVTEKFFRSMDLDILPIVYGGVDYSQFAPPMSFIDVKDYASPEELASYLLYLDKNPSEYEKYFWWKKYYKVSLRLNHILCNLCEMLNNPFLPEKVYDIEKWWNNQNMCHSAQNHFVQSYYQQSVFNSRVWDMMKLMLILFFCACILLGFIYCIHSVLSL